MFSSVTWACLFILVTINLGLVSVTTASRGDESWAFAKCFETCLETNCTRSKLVEFHENQPTMERLLKWSCPNECEYECMWPTIDAFEKDGSTVPQFHGKWPFIRVFGVQEPASVIFSMLNGLAHLVMIIKFHRSVPRASPMFYAWNFYALLGINTWTWSTIFHARDVPFTEKADYFSAVALLMASTWLLCLRLHGTKNWLAGIASFSALLGLYAYHIHYLAFVHFDYGYNMRVTVFIGAVNFVGWMIWCFLNRKTLSYFWKCSVTMVMLNLMLSLELLDFVPLGWVIDAHSLWHAGTAPLNLLWYSFAIDDCKYLLAQKQRIPEVDKKKAA